MCWKCDNPQATEAEYEARLRMKIERFGWAIQGIEPGRTSPPWAYTVGLSRFGQPELVLTGMTFPSASALLNDMAAHLLHDAAPEPGTQQQLVRGPLVEFVELAEPSAHLHWAAALFGPSLRAIQVVHADQRGHWPWHPGYRGGPGGQPVLGPRNREALT